MELNCRDLGSSRMTRTREWQEVDPRKSRRVPPPAHAGFQPLVPHLSESVAYTSFALIHSLQPATPLRELRETWITPHCVQGSVLQPGHTPPNLFPKFQDISDTLAQCPSAPS